MAHSEVHLIPWTLAAREETNEILFTQRFQEFTCIIHHYYCNIYFII